ncbi:MAG: cytochrome c3 family protein [Sulfurimonas sp.]
MKLLRFCLRAALLLCVSTLGISADEKSIEIIAPIKNHLQSELTLNIVAKVDKKGVDTLKITTALEQIDIDIKSQRETECKNISLRLGENRVVIRAYKNGILVDEKTRDVYVSSQLYHQFKYPPQKYSKNYFHTDANEKSCVKCHDMSVNEVKNVAFVDVTKSNCYGCHKNITKEKYAHAPAANWLCTSCHNKKNQSKYIAPEPVNHSCFECHEENKELWSSAKYTHEPLDSGDCNRCHNPHSSPYAMFIRKEVNEICLGCHKEQNSRARNSKSSGCTGVDESQKCTSCHTPHASDQPFFLKKTVKKAAK